jgi:hypothetical protein
MATFGPVIGVELERVEALELLVDDEPGQAGSRNPGGKMSYSGADVTAANIALEKYRGSEAGEVGAALVVVGLSAERAAKEARNRDDMIRVAHDSGVSIRQLSEASGLGRKTVTAIVSSNGAIEN